VVASGCADGSGNLMPRGREDRGCRPLPVFVCVTVVPRCPFPRYFTHFLGVHSATQNLRSMSPATRTRLKSFFALSPQVLVSYRARAGIVCEWQPHKFKVNVQPDLRLAHRSRGADLSHRSVTTPFPATPCVFAAPRNSEILARP